MHRVKERSAPQGDMTSGAADKVGSNEGPPRQRSAKPGFRPDIEGLRAVAVLAVVLFHAAVPGVGGGFVGVDVFFVISGFLITGLLWREVSSTGTVRLRRFYGARARRLLPASAAVGVVTAIASAFLLPPLQAPSVMVTASPARCMSATSGSSCNGSRLLRRRPAAIAVPALLVFGRRGAVLSGVAGLDHRYGVAHPACASAQQRAIRRRRRGRIWSSSCWSRLCRLRCRWWPPTVVPSVAFFSLPTRAWQLAVGGLVALTAGQWRRLPATFAAHRGMGRAGPDPVGLHPIEPRPRPIRVPPRCCLCSALRW